MTGRLEIERRAGLAGWLPEALRLILHTFFGPFFSGWVGDWVGDAKDALA